MFLRKLKYMEFILSSVQTTSQISLWLPVQISQLESYHGAFLPVIPNISLHAEVCKNWEGFYKSILSCEQSSWEGK